MQVADPALEPKSRMSDRQQIRKNLRRGYTIEAIPGPAQLVLVGEVCDGGAAMADEREAFAVERHQLRHRPHVANRNGMRFIGGVGERPLGEVFPSPGRAIGDALKMRFCHGRLTAPP